MNQTSRDQISLFNSSIGLASSQINFNGLADSVKNLLQSNPNKNSVTFATPDEDHENLKGT